MKAELYSIEGKKTGDIDLPKGVFDVPSNNELVHQVYVAQDANRRTGSAHTKVRSAVRGGGKKPWKQKGTGNARTGSIRNPIWRGGGTIFGPSKLRNYSKAINSKMKRKALLIALSEKARNNKVIVSETLTLTENKTKNFAQFLAGTSVTGRSFVLALDLDARGTHVAVKNIPKSNAMEVEKLNVFDIMNAQYLILSKESLKQLEKLVA